MAWTAMATKIDGNIVSATDWNQIVNNFALWGAVDGNCRVGRMNIGSQTSATNGNNAAGLNIDQGAAGDEVLTLQSSTVAHGMTTIGQTNSFALFQKRIAANGGLTVRALSEISGALSLQGFATGEDTTHNSSAVACISLDAFKASGTGSAALATNGNLLVVTNAGSTRFIVDADGDLFNDGASGTSTTYDDDDDGALVEALAHLMNPARERGYRFRLATDLEAHKDALAAGGVITLNPDGRIGMVSYKGMLGLLIDGIRQVTHEHRQLASAVLPLLSASAGGAR